MSEESIKSPPGSGSYTPDTWSKDLNTDFTLGNCLFEAMKLTKNADPDKNWI